MRDAPNTRSRYVRAGVLLSNTLIVLVVANAILGLAWAWRDRKPRSQLLEQYGVERLLPSYPGWSAPELEALLLEDSTESEYEPLTEFRPKPKRGRFVNVDPGGFRAIENQKPWPPDPNAVAVFVFGGSTAFGAGLRDEETIASRLQALFEARGCESRAAVYNFGRPDYFSSQERVLFENLLAAGRVPAIAVFLDGLNDFYHWDGAPGWSVGIHALVEHANARGELGPAAADFVRRTPFARTAAAISRALGIAAPTGLAAGGTASALEVDDPVRLRGAIDRWLSNMRLIEATSRAFGVRPLFVWQPVPTHAYDLAVHNLARGDLTYFRAHQRSHYGYALMETIRPTLGLGAEVLWLDEIQRGRQENLYVDGVHYTAAFSNEIAESIVSHLGEHEPAVCSARAPAR